ncbi:unnamed protein product [Effrenium voratum]|uniref:Uncharacterized protein n=1 Tax=Effrenium voratum TaxID=2562239 RepID=A0AA36JBS1_9DINO|nr:unnamed protein product [Effrenium voratum]
MADASERHDDASDDEAEEWPEGQCGLCEQSFEQQDEDAPPGTALLVSPRGVSHGMCLRCYYIKRGSFGGLKSGELRRLMRKNIALKDKFRSLRRKQVRASSRNPKARPRHETVDVRLYTERRDESYVDMWQEGEWMSLKDYVEAKLDPETQKKLKTTAQKRSYVTKDDLGVEGVIILPESKTKRVRMGTRKSSSRVKQGEHADGKDMDVAHQKNKSNLELEVNTKDSSFISSLSFCQLTREEAIIKLPHTTCST